MATTIQDNSEQFDVIWENDIPTPIAKDSLLNCEQFASMMEVTVDHLWAM